MRSPRGGQSAGGKGQGEGCYVPLSGEVTPQGNILGPNRGGVGVRGGVSPPTGVGMSASMHPANGEGRWPPTCGPDTEQ